MIKYYSRYAYITSLVGILVNSSAHAQIDSPAFDILDAKLTSEINPPITVESWKTVPINAVYANLAIASKNVPEGRAPLFTTRFSSIGYSHGFKNSKRRADGTDTDTDGMSARLYFGTAKGFSISPSLTYAAAEANNRVLAQTETDTYGFNLAIAQDIVPLVSGDNGVLKSNGWSITPAIDSGFRNSSRDSFDSTGDLTRADIDTWTLGIALGVSHVLRAPLSSSDPSEKTVLTFTPSYRHNDATTKSIGSKLSSTSDLLSFEGRLDYVVTRSVTMTTTVAWNHDLRQKVPSSSSSRPTNRDWAEIAMRPTFNIATKWKLRATLAYEAFHPDYFNYKLGFDVLYYF